MAEIDKSGSSGGKEGGNEGQGGGSEGAGNTSKQGDSGDEDDGDGSGDGDGGKKEGDGKPSDKKDGDAGAGSQKKDDNGEPVVQNRHPSWYVAERKKRQLEKNAQGGGKDDGKGGEGDQGDGNDDNQGDDFDAKLDERLKPLAEEHFETTLNTEVSEYLAANPDFAPYKEKALKYAKHESRRHLPIQTIFFEVAGDDLMKIGAAREKAAADAAKDSQGTGGGAAGEGDPQDVWKMPAETFEAKKERIRQGR